MRVSTITRAAARLVAVAIVAAGFTPYSGAAVVSSQEFVQQQLDESRVSRIEAMLARDNVAASLERYGVSPELVASRLRHLTAAELAAVEETIADGIAGGDALGVIGAVFLVLLILELVGVTDIFTAL